MKTQSIVTVLLACILVMLSPVSQQRPARAQDGGTTTVISVASNGTQVIITPPHRQFRRMGAMWPLIRLPLT